MPLTTATTPIHHDSEPVRTPSTVVAATVGSKPEVGASAVKTAANMTMVGGLVRVSMTEPRKAPPTEAAARPPSAGSSVSLVKKVFSPSQIRKRPAARCSCVSQASTKAETPARPSAATAA